MRPHMTVIVMCLCGGLAMLGARWWQQYDYRQQVRLHSTRSVNNLTQLAIAVYNYSDEHNRWPSPAIYSKGDKPLLSWRVLLLPYLEQEELYKQFHLDEPWDSPHNITLLPMMPALYEFYADHKTRLPNKTYYRVFVGPGAAFEGPTRLYFGSFGDGRENTFLIVEAAEAVPWTAPEELNFDPVGPLPKLGGHSPDSFLAAMCDGRIVRIGADTTPKAIRAAISRNGGEKLRWQPADF